MSTYELTEEGKQQLKRSLILLLTVSMTVAVSPVFVILYMTMYASDPLQFVEYCLIFAAFVVVVTWMNGRSALKSQQSLRLTFESDRLIEEKLNKRQVIIRRIEVKKIVKVKDEALRVDSNVSAKSIFVPKSLNGFDELKEQLSSWAIIGEPDKREFFYAFILVYGTLAIVIAATILKSRVLWGVVGIILVVHFVYAFLQDIKSMKSLSKWGPLIVLLLLALLVFILTELIR